MREVTLMSVELENFKSFTHAHLLLLSTGAGFKFLGGDNKIEKRLGANGAGKSSLLDGLFWCLYGQGVKGQKAGELVTWGKKRPRVAVVLTIQEAGEQREVVVSRLGAPEQLKLNGVAATQAEIDSVLALSRHQFKHAVLFGQNVPFFADLPIAARGVLLDEVLDLAIWQDASDTAGAAARQHAEDAATKALMLENQRGVLAGLPDQAELVAQRDEWLRKREEDVESLLGALETAAAKLDKLEATLRTAKATVDLDKEYKEKAAQLAEFEARNVNRRAEVAHARATDVRKAAAKALNHLHDHPTCPTCAQAWPKATHANRVLAAEAALEEAVVLEDHAAEAWKKSTESLTAAEESYAALSKALAAARGRVQHAEGGVVPQRRAVQAMEARIEQLMEEGTGANPYSVMLDKRAAKLREVTARIEELQDEHAALLGNVEISKFWRDAFKRVRLFMTQRALKHLEIEVEAAVASLGLVGWQIQFVTETENKSGGVKQGVQIIVTSPHAPPASWESWSGGEGQRLRTAIAIGFASMLQRMRGVSYRFEMWDEPSAWLSEQGIEDLLGTLRQRAESEQLSLWLVDHRALHATAFDEIWTVSKGTNGSTVARE